MASALSNGINLLKYAKLRVKNAGSWAVLKELWVKQTTWKEPISVWIKKSGTWTRVTTPTRYVKFNGSSAYLTCGTTAQFNNYRGAGLQAYFEFKIILTSIATVQTIYSYGSATSYFTIEVGTDGKVYVKSRYNSGTAYSHNHATALSLNTVYTIRIELTNGSDGYIIVKDVNGNTVGSNLAMASGSTGWVLVTAAKFIGKRYDSVNYFSGYLLHVNMFGGTYSGTDVRHDSNQLASSTVGSGTVTDSYTADGSQNLVGTNATVEETG